MRSKVINSFIDQFLIVNHISNNWLHRPCRYANMAILKWLRACKVQGQRKFNLIYLLNKQLFYYLLNPNILEILHVVTRWGIGVRWGLGMR